MLFVSLFCVIISIVDSRLAAYYVIVIPSVEVLYGLQDSQTLKCHDCRSTSLWLSTNGHFYKTCRGWKLSVIATMLTHILTSIQPHYISAHTPNGSPRPSLLPLLSLLNLFIRLVIKPTLTGPKIVHNRIAQVTIKNKSPCPSVSDLSNIPFDWAIAEIKNPISPLATMALPKMLAGYSDCGLYSRKILHTFLALLFVRVGGGAGREKRTSQMPQAALPRAMRREKTIPRQRVSASKSLLMGIEKPMEPWCY